MRKKSTSESTSKAFRRPHLFGPPPILAGEDAKAYHEMLDRVSGALGPTDFIEEIWVRDLVDVTWAMLRWRRLQATFWSDEVSDIVDHRASTRATAEAGRVGGAIKE